MSPTVLATIPFEAVADMVVAQTQAKEAGKEARWSHAYARRRRRMDVSHAARAALIDVGIEPLLSEDNP